MTDLDLIRDYHIHTSFSDGYVSPETVIQAAIDKKVHEICITDHYSYFKPALKHEDLELYFTTLEELKSIYANKIKVFIGIEVDLYSISTFDYLRGFSWDLILFEYVFSIPEWEQAFTNVLKFQGSTPSLKNIGLAHTRFSRLTHAKFEQVMTGIVENDIIIEVNSGYQNYLDPWFNYLDDTNIYSLGSDAHSPVRVGEVSGALNYLRSRKIPNSCIVKL
jgi:histidinol phosphatase-like PHP family hydrolase